MAGIRELMVGLFEDEPGFRLRRGCDPMLLAMLQGSGYIKAHAAGNAPDTWQIRITGAGKDFTKRMLDIEEHLRNDDKVTAQQALEEIVASVNEHFEIREMDPTDGG